MSQDPEMAGRGALEEPRSRRRQWLLTATWVTGVALLLVLPPLVSFFQNRALTRAVREAISTVRREDRDELARLQDLSRLEQQLQVLTRYQTEGVPFWMRFGRYEGNRLLPQARSAYHAALRRVLFGHQYQRLEQELGVFSGNPGSPDWTPGAEDYARQFDALKLYLLITWPHAPREPALDASHQDWLMEQMLEHWEHVKGPGGEAPQPEALTTHARAYLQLLAEDPEHLAFPRKDDFVRAAREALDRVPVTTLELDRIVADASRENPDLTLEGLAGAVPALRATRSVRGAFTRAAWERGVRSRLESAFRGKEAWVLDRDAREDAERSRAELRALYFRQYIQEWRDFLQSLTLQPPGDVGQMQALLESLTRGEPPALVKLFQALASNVRLGEPDVEEAFSTLLVFTTGESDPEEGEERLPSLDFYQEQLARALEALRGVKEKPSETGAWLEQLKNARAGVTVLVKRYAKYEGDGPLLEKLLLPPLQDMSSSILASGVRTRSEAWCETIARPFSQLMANRYPFVRESTQDVPLAWLSEFLRPSGGTLRTFLQQHLADVVTPSGRKWTFATLGARDLYRDELLTFLEKSSALATTLFPGDTAEPLVRFQARIRAGTSPDTSPSELSSITLTIDGLDETYRNGPAPSWEPMLWPGQGGRPGAHLHVENASGASADLDEPGPWGLFRLLERARSIEPSGDGRFFTAVWEPEELNGALVAIDFRPERTAHPFLGLSGSTVRPLQLFREPGLTPPRGLVRGGRDCVERVSTLDVP